LVERFDRQFRRLAQFGGRRRDPDDRVAQSHQQIQRGGVQAALCQKPLAFHERL
jgi:hypothetical protein